MPPIGIKLLSNHLSKVSFEIHILQKLCYDSCNTKIAQGFLTVTLTNKWIEVLLTLLVLVDKFPYVPLS